MKKILLGYSAFAPYIALAMACRLSPLLGIRDEEELIKLAFTVMACTIPLCAWLYINSGHFWLSYIMIDAHITLLALPMIPRRCYEFTIMLSLIITGYGILTTWDYHRKMKKITADAEDPIYAYQASPVQTPT